MNKMLPWVLLLATLSLPAMAATVATAMPANRLQQQLRKRDAEVKHLQQVVTQQEAKSRQAGQQLEQRDRAIADLQRQLEALERGPAAAPDHH
jgi:septal ring factor EnvC (AmiA/AmiB activator)